MRRLLLTLLLLFCAAQLPAQDFTSDFKSLKDTLTTLSCEHFAVKSQIEVWRVMRRGKNLDIYFSRHLSDYPWRAGDAEWFRNTLKEFWPENLSGYRLGEIFCRSTNLKDLITPGPGNGNGKPQNYKFSFLSHKQALLSSKNSNRASQKDSTAETSPFGKAMDFILTETSGVGSALPPGER